MDVHLRGRKISLDPSYERGRGEEAQIFVPPGLSGKAVKVFKPPTHPDYESRPDAQAVARERIAEHQEKLPAFPKGLPLHAVVPEELVYDSRGKIAGYTMRFIAGADQIARFAEQPFRQNGVPAQRVVSIFQDLWGTVDGLHQKGVIIGDFHHYNVLVAGSEAFLIDTDSFQFDRFLCTMYTERFVDPLLCDPLASSPELVRPYAPDADWYAFSVMFMQSLLFTGPYDGVYRPRNPAAHIPFDARPLRRITIFHPDVRCLKIALPPSVLPDDLLHHFHEVFEKDRRGIFPRNLLESLQWTRCTNCGMEHARRTCPHCAHAAPAPEKVAVKVLGNVTSRTVFRTRGVILFAAMQGGVLRWLYHEDGMFRREDQSMVMTGRIDPQVRYRICGERTMLGRENVLVTLGPAGRQERATVDCYGTLSIFDANERRRYWVQSGHLMRDGQFAPERIGDVLTDQTLFWVGKDFGFGFYRAGTLHIAFVFDADRPGLNDGVKIPRFQGQLIDSTCVFGKDVCWFFLALQERGKIVHRCFVIDRTGTVLAEDQGSPGNGDWLSGIRGKCASGNFLLAATDNGIVRLEAANGKITKTKEFPNTEPFVNAGSHIFLEPDGGLYVVSGHEISLLTIS